MASIHARAETYLAAVPPYPGEIWSDRDEALFKRLTGYTHAGLVKIWKGGGKDKDLTTCNAFTGEFGKALGSGGGLFAGFMVDDLLKKNGKGAAWVPSSDDVRPGYGDIFVKLPRYSHMGISLGFKDGTWNTVESGQGKVGERDIIARKHRTFDSSALAGWVDIEVFFAGAVPHWLVGWWEVTWRGQTYYYFFNVNHHVKWTKFRPRDSLAPPIGVQDTGNFTVEAGAITVRWPTGSVEKFGPTTEQEQMRGTWNGTEPITAKRM